MVHQYREIKVSSTSKIQYLGYNIDTSVYPAPMLTIPGERIRRLKWSIKQALEKQTISARSLARIAGQCVSMTFVIFPGKLLLRNIYRLLVKKKSWDDTLTIDMGAMRDPQWWKDAVKNWNGKLMCHFTPEVQIETDASAHGWGAQLNTHHATGTWDYYTSRQSSWSVM